MGGGLAQLRNKLWNAVRFALLNGAHVPEVAALDPAAFSVPDRWILSRLSAVIAETDQLFEAFEFGKVCDVLYHFAWDEVCDWYLELAKVPLTSDEAGAAETTRQVLGFVLDQLLRLLHPVMPFVTEELWTALTGEDSVMVAPWPTFSYGDPAAEAEISSLTRLVTEIRRFRSDQGLRPGQRVAARLAGIESTPLAGHEERIRSLLRLSLPGDGFTASASLEVEGIMAELDVAGVIDVAAERRRMEKDLAAARSEADQAERKLANAEFTAKAPGRRGGEDPPAAGGRPGGHRPHRAASGGASPGGRPPGTPRYAAVLAVVSRGRGAGGPRGPRDRGATPRATHRSATTT